MTETTDGVIRRTETKNEVHFERSFDAPVEKLWSFIAERDLLAKWMGGPIDKLELKEGGEVVIQIAPKLGATVYGKVLEIQPGRLLKFTWDVPAWGKTPDLVGTVMRWEAVPDGAGSKILLTHALPYTVGREHLLASAWHQHLDQLGELLKGNDQNYQIEHARIVSLTQGYLDKDFAAQKANYGELLNMH